MTKVSEPFFFYFREVPLVDYLFYFLGGWSPIEKALI